MQNGFCMPILSTNSRGVLPVNIQRWQTTLGVTRERPFCPSSGTAKDVLLLELLPHNTSITTQLCLQQLSRLAVQLQRSSGTTAPSASFTTMPDPTSQKVPAKSCLSWAWKCSSPHCTNHTWRPPTITWFYPRAVHCNSRPSTTKMTWTNGWRFYWPPSSKPFLMMATRMCPEKVESDRLCP